MGTQSGGSREVCSCRLTMRLPYLPSLLLVVTILPVTIAEPDVFGDYFDDGMKLVDISQDAALRSCLSDGKTADKTKAAYDGCYGQGYDFDDLAKAGGDDDGLPDELEEKEGCFYKKMGWVSEDNVMDEAVIAADMEGLENQIQKGFLSDVGTCIAWSGNFGERRRREAGLEGQDTQDRELVPGLMDTERRAMGWVKKLVRKVRSPGTGQSKKNRKCPKGPEGKECRSRRRGRGKGGRRKSGRNNRKNNRKSIRKKNKKTGRNKKKARPGKGRRGRSGKGNAGKGNKKAPKKRNGKGARKGDRQGRRRNGGRGGRRGNSNNKKGGNGRKKDKKKKKENKKEDNNRPGKRNNRPKKKKNKDTQEKKEDGKRKKDKDRTRSGKNKNAKSLPEAVYNKLWCIDLAIEQALEK